MPLPTAPSHRPDPARSAPPVRVVLAATFLIGTSLLALGSFAATGGVNAVAPSASTSPSGSASPAPSYSPAPTSSAPPPLDHLVLAPDPATVAAGGSQAYAAEGFAANGFDLGDVTSATTFTIDAPGTCLAAACGSLSVGTYTVTGNDNGITATATLHVALPPDPVSNVTVVAGDGVAWVSWSAPTSDGGSPITDYTVSSGAEFAPTSFDGGTTAVMLTGLTNDTAYEFAVTATNLAGTSPAVTAAAVMPEPYTPTGTDVAVVPTTDTGTASPVTTTFSDVTGTGTTTVSVIDTSDASAPPAPNAGYEISGSPVYYDIQTTAAYDGQITVCISYAGITPAPTTLLHYDTTVPGWVALPTTIDTEQQVICGTSSSLSPFALVSTPVLTVPSDIGVMATSSAGADVTYRATSLDFTDQPLAPACTPVSGSTFPVGTTTVACSATDRLGRTASGTFTVTVGYGFSGFFQPLDDPISATDPLSVFRQRSTVPVKFALTYADGTPIADAAASTIATACGATISLRQTSGTAPSTDEVVTSTTPNEGDCFRYDSTAHQFVFNLGTDGLAPGVYALTASIVGPDTTPLATHRLDFGIR